MPIADINYLAVLIAAVVSFAIGAFWYSPAGFGKQWAAMMGITFDKSPEKKKAANKAMAIAFVGTLVMAYVLAHFVDYVEATTFGAGIVLGFWLWLGFLATSALGSVLWEGKPVKLYLINASYQLVNVAIMGGILAMWQ